MKNTILFFLSFFFTLLFKSQVKENLKIPPNPTIGLSLAGGGAKGFAHIGVLKVIDSLGIKIDYISGTSMGAIVGGLYASGYSGELIEQMVMQTDFYTIITNEKNRQDISFFSKNNDKYLISLPINKNKVKILPKAISSGQKNFYLLKELFKNVANTQDFSKLPIPFMCMATNLETGENMIFEQGDLVKSIMASSAFPSLMDPVEIKGNLYIDGAITLNYPSKPLKDKGIDIVIGVDLSQPLSKRENLNSILNILNQVIDFGIKKETQNQYKYTDVNIQPELNNITATSYGEKEIIMKKGEKEALKYLDILQKLPKNENKNLRTVSNPIFTNVYKIDSLVVENASIFTNSYIQGKMNLSLPSLQTYGNINKMIDKLYATNNFNIINYDIEQTKNGNVLKVNTTEDETRFFLKFGLHYDEIFKTGLLLNATAKRLLFKNSIASLDLVIGDKPRYFFNYTVDNGFIPGFGIKSFAISLDLKNRFSDILDQWSLWRNEFYIQSIRRDRYAIGGGLSYDNFKSENNVARNEKTLNPFLFIKSDTRDDAYFPNHGFYLNTEAKILDIFNNEIVEKTLQSKTEFNFSIPLNHFLTYRMHIFGGFTLSGEPSIFYRYRPGGIFAQEINNFIPFGGLQFGDRNSKNLLTTSFDFQFKIKKNIFTVAHFNILNEFNVINAENIWQITDSSLGITAGYRSPLGPIMLNFSQGLNKNKGIISVILGHYF